MALNLKGIFDLAEGGVLTYDTFHKALEEAGIKLVDLSEGEYVSKQKHEDIVKNFNTQIEGLNSTIAQREKDIKDVNEKLTKAGVDAEKLAELNKSIEDLQTKYKTDTDELNAKLSKQQYEFAVKDYANSMKFSSGAAKRDFIGSLINENLKMKDGTILGADDFKRVYEEQNADAFVVEPNGNGDGNDNGNGGNGNGAPAPNFVNPTNNNNNPNPTAGADGQFHFNFGGVRPIPKE